MNRTYLTDVQRTWLFSECSNKELRAIVSLCTPVDVDAGRVLIREGDPARECFIVLDGHAVAERGHTTIGEFSTHACVGTLSLVDGCAHSATVTAATPMRILVIDRGAFSALASGRFGWSVKHRIEVIAAEQRRPNDVPVARPTARTNAAVIDGIAAGVLVSS